MQTIASDDVAAILADIAAGEPLNGMVEIAGPKPIRLDELARRYLTATRDARTVIADPNARYYGIAVNDQSLTPGDNFRIGPTRFEEWLRRSVPEGQVKDSQDSGAVDRGKLEKWVEPRPPIPSRSGRTPG